MFSSKLTLMLLSLKYWWFYLQIVVAKNCHYFIFKEKNHWKNIGTSTPLSSARTLWCPPPQLQTTAMPLHLRSPSTERCAARSQPRPQPPPNLTIFMVHIKPLRCHAACTSLLRVWLVGGFVYGGSGCGSRKVVCGCGTSSDSSEGWWLVAIGVAAMGRSGWVAQWWVARFEKYFHVFLK